MSHPLRFAVHALLVAVLALAGCAGGETHWQKSFLAGCVSDSHCEAPLTCIRNLCTRPCSDDDGCDVATGAVCDAEGRCIVPERSDCTSAEACDDQHAGWLCDEQVVDACRTDVSVCRDGAWIDGAIDTCRGALVQTIPASATTPETVIVKRSETDAPVDVLFVVDNSTSMGRSQARLAAEVPAFVERLHDRGVGDFQIAVTTPDAQCEPTPGRASQGRFVSAPSTVIPISSAASIHMECREDADCVADACGVLGCTSAADWSCRWPQMEVCLENPNGSWNSRCTLACADDADCAAVLGDGYTCLTIGPVSSCVGALDACPAEVPTVLAGDDLALAPCALRAGLQAGEACYRYEQPLEAMRLALDPAGPNAAQHAALVRPHAILAVVVVTDEEDCSVAPGEDFVEGEQSAPWDRCGLAATIDDGGPLQTVEHYVAFLDGLKPAGRTFFATIAGDSTATDPATVDADRAAYLASKGAEPDCHAATTICATPDGLDVADYGARLFATADAMAPDSHVGNLCSGDWDATFVALGDALAETATRICLPAAPSPGFAVVRVVGTTETPLTQAPSGPGTWRLAAAAPECPSGAAVVLADPPVAGEHLHFAYAP